MERDVCISYICFRTSKQLIFRAPWAANLKMNEDDCACQRLKCDGYGNQLGTTPLLR